KAKASINVKDSDTGRELRFEGPGRVRPCSSDAALVAEGSAVGMPGAGEGPGAEQWVATTCGVAVWSSGFHRISAAADGCKMQSSTEPSHLYVAVDMTTEDTTLDGGAIDGGPPAMAPARFHRFTDKRAVRLHAKAPASRE